MRRLLKIIGIVLATIVCIVVVAAFAIPHFYKDEILQIVTEKVGKQIKADISLKSVDLTLWGNIPNISIQLHDVYAKSTQTFNKKEFSKESTDTALYAKRVLLSFNVLDFFFENYVVKEIVVRDAIVNFYLDSQSHHNWNFSIESDSSENSMFLELSKIRFQNTLTNYYDISNKIVASEWFDKINCSGKFQGDEFFIDVYAAFTNKNFKYDNKSFFAKSSFKCDLGLSRDSSTYTLKNFKFETPVGLVISDGTIKILKNNDINLNLNLNVETAFKKILDVLPQKTVDTLAPYKIETDIFVEGLVNGTISKNSMPKITCNLACTKGSVIFEKTKYSFSTKGNITAKDFSKLETFTFTSTATTISVGKSKIEPTTFTLTNFLNPKLSIAGDVQITLEDIDLLENIEDYHLSGNIVGSISCEGLIDNLTSFTNDYFTRNNIVADINCNNLSVAAPENSPYDFQNVCGKINFSNGDIKIDSTSGIIHNQKFTLQGKASNFVQYLAFDHVDTHCNFNCTIESLNATPFYEHYLTLASSPTSGSFLGSIRFETKKLDFDPYFLMNAATIVRFTENAIELSEINATTLQGKLIAGNFKIIDLPNNQKKCIASGNIEKMSAKDIFSTFNNFDQTVITDKQIDGLLSGKFMFSSNMDSDYNPIYSTTDATADIVIEDGTVRNVETLQEIGKKMKMEEEFTNVSFSTLKNTLRIKNDTLYIPNMNVVSNAFEMTFAGKHNIENNHFDYYVMLFLKKTLSLKFNNKNKDTEDFGEIEKNTDGNFKVPIKIFGNPEQYEIVYDLKKSKENVKQSLDNQKSEWKEILNKSEDSTSKKEVEKPIESNFEIEWD